MFFFQQALFHWVTAEFGEEFAEFVYRPVVLCLNLFCPLRSYVFHRRRWQPSLLLWGSSRYLLRYQDPKLLMYETCFKCGNSQIEFF